MIVKRLKNNTPDSKYILTRTIEPSQYYDLPFRLWVEALDNEDIIQDIKDQVIVVNNGVEDLNVSDGLHLINQFQDHITETTLNSMIQVDFSKNGKAKNRWLERTNKGISSDSTPFIIPFKCKLVCMTFSNSKHSVECNLEVWKLTEANLFTASWIDTWEIRNTRVARKSDFSQQIIFNAGDILSVYTEDRGTDPTDIVFSMYFQIIEDNTTESSRTWNWGL